MMNELLEAATTVVQHSAVPLTISQIWSAVKRERKVPNKDRFSREIGKDLPGQPGIHLWPEFRRSALYFNRPLDACVEEALLRALKEQPLSAAKAAGAVKKALRFVSETRIAKEIKMLLPRQTASGAIFRLPISRQSAIYLSQAWIAEQARGGGDHALMTVLPAVIARLQAISGTYVRIDHLRKTPEVRAVLDRAVIRLADAGELVLSHYDGPLPVPDEHKWTCIEDNKGDLFIGVALARDLEVPA